MFRRTSEWRAFDMVQKGDLAALEKLARAERRRGRNILNGVDDEQGSLLHAAVFHDHEHIIRWLLCDDEGGRALGFTNVLAKDDYGFTALHFAACKGRLDWCKLIVEGCKVENGEREEMLNAIAGKGDTILHRAAFRAENVVRWLLSNEAGGGRSYGFKSETITALNNYSRSALDEARFFDSVGRAEALLSGCTAGERIKLFLVVNEQGETPLHQAARYGKVELIREILRWEEAKVMVNTRDHQGMTALHRMVCQLNAERYWEWGTAFFDVRQNEEVVRILLGLDPTTAATFADVNAGLHISEEAKIAAAAASAAAAAKKRVALEKEEKAKRDRVENLVIFILFFITFFTIITVVIRKFRWM